MSSVTTLMTTIERLGFSYAAASYLAGTCGIDPLDEITSLDGIDDVDITIKGAVNPGVTEISVTVSTAITSLNNIITV
jgi:hypothetical protein